MQVLRFCAGCIINIYLADADERSLASMASSYLAMGVAVLFKTSKMDGGRNELEDQPTWSCSSKSSQHGKLTTLTFLPLLSISLAASTAKHSSEPAIITHVNTS